MTATASSDVEPASTATSLAARTVGLRKTYGKTVAVDGVDLDVPHGCVLGVLGPNGSGKTTTIRMLLGLTRPTSGTVELLGEAMPQHAAHVLPEVGALVEGPGFHPFLSGKENLRRLAAAEPLLRSGSMKATVETSLERVGLAHAAQRKFRGYSLGMKQRLGLAAALLVPRRLVVLDEPTNGLDPAGTREIRKVIADLHAEGTTVLVSSHLLAEVEATCTHVAVLHKGTLVQQGVLADLLEAGAPALNLSTSDNVAAVSVLEAHHITARRENEHVRVELNGTAPESVVRVLVHADIGVREARRTRAGLEDIFAQLTEPVTEES